LSYLAGLPADHVLTTVIVQVLVRCVSSFPAMNRTLPSCCGNAAEATRRCSFANVPWRQHGGEPDAGAEVLGIGGDGDQGLGRDFEQHLAVRIASRHPDRAKSLFSGDVSGVESAHADVNDDGSVARAVAAAWAVVNTVSLYAERGKCTFCSVHVDAAKRIAMLARQAGAEILVHISGIGADAGSASPYIRSRGEGRGGSPSFVSFGQVGSAGCHVRTW
jgi:hypothetical protein